MSNRVYRMNATIENSLRERAVRLLGSPGSSRDTRRVTDEMETAIPGMDVAQLPEMLELYTLLHRVSYHTVPDPAFIASHSERCFLAWLHGDRRISDTDIACLMHGHIARDPRTVPAERLHWYCDRIVAWCGQITRTGRFTDTRTPAEVSRRAMILLHEDLYAYTDDVTGLRACLIELISE